MDTTCLYTTVAGKLVTATQVLSSAWWRHPLVPLKCSHQAGGSAIRWGTAQPPRHSRQGGSTGQLGNGAWHVADIFLLHTCPHSRPYKYHVSGRGTAVHFSQHCLLSSCSRVKLPQMQRSQLPARPGGEGQVNGQPTLSHQFCSKLRGGRWQAFLTLQLSGSTSPLCGENTPKSIL